MRIICLPILVAVILVAGSIIGAFWQTPEATSVSAVASVPSSHSRRSTFHAIEECSEYKEAPGSFCTITSSDFTVIPHGSKVYYLQSPIAPIGLLDSNIVLDASQGNRAVGRCTLDLVSHAGLCTFSDGIGKLAGFQARVDVSAPSADLVKFDWRGTYNFKGDDTKSR